MTRRSAPRYVNKLSNKIRRELGRKPVMNRISQAEGRVLYYLLDQDGPVVQRDVEEEFSMRAPSASALLKRMEEDGLITRSSAAEDARYKLIQVTEKGSAHKDEVLAEIHELEETATRGISEEDMETFYRVVETMLKNLP